MWAGGIPLLFLGIGRSACHTSGVATEGNGQGESRLDRLERLLVEGAARNQEAHESFMQEHQLLLRAQVVMVDTMTKIEAKMVDVGSKMVEIETKMVEIETKMLEIETKMLEIQEKLDATVRIVDGLIPRQGAQ